MRPNDILTEEDLLLQLAEESAELAQAAAKLARHKRGVNPTGRSEKEIIAQLEEELTDVLIAAAELPYRPDWDIARKKKERWIERLERQRNEREGLAGGMARTGAG